MNPLVCQSLAAGYDGRSVFAGLALDLPPGAYALQGANGSGKSTLLQLLAGAKRSVAGRVSIAGHDLATTPLAARAALAYVPDESPVYPFMTDADFLAFVAAARHTAVGSVATGLIEALGLTPHLDTRFDALSLGTQKKLLLAAGWIGAPAVVLMDEPSNGLDAAARDTLAARIRADSAGKVLLFASHDADFVTATGATILRMSDLVAPLSLSA